MGHHVRRWWGRYVCKYMHTIYIYVHRCMHSSVYHSFGFFSSVPTESRWLKVIRRSPRARCLPMPSLCRRAVRSIRKRTQRFQSTLQSFPRSAQRGGRYLNLWLCEVTNFLQYLLGWRVCLSECEGSRFCFGLCAAVGKLSWPLVRCCWSLWQYWTF